MTANCCLLMIACLLGAGCAATKPVHYYSLGPETPRTSQERPDGLTILVGDIGATEALQDERIRYRAGHEAGAYEYHQWKERPAVMVRDELIRALRASGKYRRVLESGSTATGDYLIRGRLHEFDEVDSPAIHTRISLHLELIDKKTSGIVWDHVFDREEPSNGKDMKDVVDSMDRNLSQVETQVAQEVDGFLAGRPRIQ